MIPRLIIFAREPVPGLSKTRLIPHLGAGNATALAAAFTLDALAKARSLGLPLVIAGSAADGALNSRYFKRLARQFDAQLIDQGAGGLGLRMRRALELFIDGGAILFGTDTPSLPASALIRAVALMRRNRVVLGPSIDGGYYLIGIRGGLPDIFRGIRWGGSRVLRETIARLRRDRVRFALAPAWYDIDRRSDLPVLARHLQMIPARKNPCPATTAILHRLGLL